MKFNFDNLVVRQNSIFGSGWILHPSQPIESVELNLTLAGGAQVTLPVSYPKTRPDVASVHPQIEHAARSGFLAYGGWTGAQITAIELVGYTKGHQPFCVPVPLERFGIIGSSSSAAFIFYRTLIRRAWNLLRTGQVSALREKVNRYFAGKPKVHADPVAAIKTAVVAAGSERILLLVDHDLGGGANHFRNKLMRKRIEAGEMVVLLTYHVPTLQYALVVQTSLGQERVAISGLDVILSLAEQLTVTELYFNNAVSFSRPEDIPDLLSTLKRAYGMPFTVAVHDYFSICPSQFLLNAEGVFCRIPDPEVCRTCLPRNSEGFATLFTSGDISVWREKWGNCLGVADKIICFSNSSYQLIRKAYPHLSAEKIRVEPHVLEYVPHRKPRLTNSDVLHLGIVGAIGKHKGAGVIRDLANEIRRRGLATRITVIGSLEEACDANVVSETGSYQPNQLPERIEKSDANIFFVPSICPETFSYVTQELMAMEVPVACFDFGAPAERVGSYEKGLVIPLNTPGEILDNLLEFHQAQYRKN